MSQSKGALIRSLTSNLDRSRLGNYVVQSFKLRENLLWQLVNLPDGSQQIVLERMSEEAGHWSSTLLTGVPTPPGAAALHFTDDFLGSEQTLRWVAFASKHATRCQAITAFRRSLKAGMTLRVNGYAYELVRRLRDTAEYGWVVKRDGTEMRLTGKTMETAIKSALVA